MDQLKQARLTERDLYGRVRPKNVLKDEYLEQLLEKVAYFEDLQDAGLLSILPCREGSTVYKIMNNTEACRDCKYYSDFYGMDSMCDAKDAIIHEPKYAKEPLCDKQFYEIVAFVVDLQSIIRNLDNFGKTVFLDKDKAEIALKKLERGEKL